MRRTVGLDEADFNLFALASALCALNACVTPRQRMRSPRSSTNLRRWEWIEKTCAKIANHRVLSCDDICQLLVEKRVPGPLSSLSAEHAAYLIGRRIVPTASDLTKAGAGADLMNYLGQSNRLFRGHGAQSDGQSRENGRNHPYYSDPFFLGPPPFAYEWPGEWDDPGWIETVF